MKTSQEKLAAICAKYCGVEFSDNFAIGGGLAGGKFASNRHEDARQDEGKLTLGEATAIFKKATGLTSDQVSEVLEYSTPNMEWHHAGLLPKAYGGGMKKTYFINSREICNAAKNWESLIEKLALSKAAEQKAREEKKNLEAKKLEFLQANAKKVDRVSKEPLYFYLTGREMNGKYGWFDSTYKSYKLPEYFSGWEFESGEKYNNFLACF